MAPSDHSNSAPDSWHEALVGLLAEVDAARTPEAEAGVMNRLASFDPELQMFIVERMAEQESPEAAAFLAALVTHPAASDAVRARAQAALVTFAEHGITPPPSGSDTFHAGWVQASRERGEQIMILGWRGSDGRLEALVFLLNWRGDGLKDFYRTRELNDAEWQQLVEHNGQKGAPLVAITLEEGRALLEDALAEGKRFSRPVPREYRAATSLIQRRILDTPPPAAIPPQRVSPELDPPAVVEAYIRALHYRDYLLAWELLAPDHPQRQANGRADGVDALRREHKHAPRRRPDAVTSWDEKAEGSGDATVVLAEGEEEIVESSGRRVRHAVRERYSLRRSSVGWRITSVERL